MELRHLRYFLEVANTLHFGAAAEALGIAVPTLSVQIAQLERELGTSLLVRSQRRVQLTQAGEILRDEAQATLAQAEQARARVQSAARGERGYLRVGYVSSTLLSGVLSSLFNHYRQQYPDVAVEVSELPMEGMAAQLVEGKLDVALVRGTLALPAEITHLALHHDHFCLALSDGHPLAQTAAIVPESLRQQTFILPEQRSGTVEVVKRGGFTLEHTRRAGALTEVLANVALGNGVAVVPAVMAQTINLPGVCYREIAGDEIPSVLWLLYRKRERTAAIKKLVALAKEQIAD
ncbi:LysR substrate-binding domain-containing protein [Kluyvera sichuanensis]|uniref:LysR substrate-binding domain-containing protein n=1 Tax=Kluyvera sichuanensis TaxID=2725494 RepID=UPI0039F5873E